MDNIRSEVVQIIGLRDMSTNQGVSVDEVVGCALEMQLLDNSVVRTQALCVAYGAIESLDRTLPENMALLESVGNFVCDNYFSEKDMTTRSVLLRLFALSDPKRAQLSIPYIAACETEQMQEFAVGLLDSLMVDSNSN